MSFYITHQKTLKVPQSLADLGPIKALPDEELGSLLASFFNTEEWLPKEAFRALLTKCLDLYLGSLDLGLERLFSRKNFLLILTLEFNRKILRFLPACSSIFSFGWFSCRTILFKHCCQCGDKRLHFPLDHEKVQPD